MLGFCWPPPLMFASSLLWCLSYGPLVTGLLTTFLLFFLLVDADTIIIITAHLDHPRCLSNRMVHLLLDCMVLILVCACVWTVHNEYSGAGLHAALCWTHGPSFCCEPAISALLFWDDFITGTSLFQSQLIICLLVLHGACRLLHPVSPYKTIQERIEERMRK